MGGEPALRELRVGELRAHGLQVGVREVVRGAVERDVGRVANPLPARARLGEGEVQLGHKGARVHLDHAGWPCEEARLGLAGVDGDDPVELGGEALPRAGAHREARGLAAERDHLLVERRQSSLERGDLVTHLLDARQGDRPLELEGDELVAQLHVEVQVDEVLLCRGERRDPPVERRPEVALREDDARDLKDEHGEGEQAREREEQRDEQAQVAGVRGVALLLGGDARLFLLLKRRRARAFELVSALLRLGVGLLHGVDGCDEARVDVIAEGAAARSHVAPLRWRQDREALLVQGGDHERGALAHPLRGGLLGEQVGGEGLARAAHLCGALHDDHGVEQLSAACLREGERELERVRHLEHAGARARRADRRAPRVHRLLAHDARGELGVYGGDEAREAAVEVARFGARDEAVVDEGLQLLAPEAIVGVPARARLDADLALIQAQHDEHVLGRVEARGLGRPRLPGLLQLGLGRAAPAARRRVDRLKDDHAKAVLGGLNRLGGLGGAKGVALRRDAHLGAQGRRPGEGGVGGQGE